MLIYSKPDVEILVCEFLKDIDDWNYSNVSTPFWRIYLSETPGAVITCDKREIELSPDHIYMISGNKSFSAKFFREFDQFFIHFIAGYPYDRLKPEIFILDKSNSLVDKIRRIKTLLRDPREITAHLMACTYSFVYDCLLQIPETRFLDVKRYDERIEKTVKYISGNLSEPFSNDDLAKNINMSTNAFIRLFKQETGESPKRFLRRKKIELACLLLQNTTRTIDEIAAETGFIDRYHFSRIFKQSTERSPVEFRKYKLRSILTGIKV